MPRGREILPKGDANQAKTDREERAKRQKEEKRFAKSRAKRLGEVDRFRQRCYTESEGQIGIFQAAWSGAHQQENWAYFRSGFYADDAPKARNEAHRIVDSMGTDLGPIRPTLQDVRSDQVVRWTAQGRVLYSWLQTYNVYTLSCVPNILDIIEARQAAEAAQSVLRRPAVGGSQAQDGLGWCRSVKDVLTGIVTISRSPVSAEAWYTKRGINTRTKLTALTEDRRDALKPLGMDLTPDVTSIVYVRRRDFSHVFDWITDDIHVTKIVPSQTFDSKIPFTSASAAAHYMSPTTGSIDLSDLRDLEESAEEDYGVYSQPYAQGPAQGQGGSSNWS